MLKVKKNFAVLFLLGIMLIISGCGNKRRALEADKIIDAPQTNIDYSSIEGLNLQPGSEIALIVMDIRYSYWQAVITGAQKAIEDFNEQLGYEGEDSIRLTIESGSTELDVDGQINVFDTILAENPDAVIIAAIDADSCEAQLETALENKIPVIAIDSGLNSDMIHTVCATDNSKAAEEAAKKICELMNDKGRIGLFVHNTATQTSQEREQGFIQEVENNHPNVEITYISYEEEDKDLVEEVKELITSQAELDCLFGLSGTMVELILDACQQLKTTDYLIAGFDTSQKQVEALLNQDLAGTMAQNPYGMGYASVVAAAREILELGNDSFIETSYQWLDILNIGLEEMDKYIYN